MVLLYQHPFFYRQQGDFPIILILDLNDLEFTITAACSSLYYCQNLSHVFKELLLCSIKLYISITTLMSLALSIWVLFFFH